MSRDRVWGGLEISILTPNNSMEMTHPNHTVKSLHFYLLWQCVVGETLSDLKGYVRRFHTDSVGQATTD